MYIIVVYKAQYCTCAHCKLHHVLYGSSVHVELIKTASVSVVCIVCLCGAGV